MNFGTWQSRMIAAGWDATDIGRVARRFYTAPTRESHEPGVSATETTERACLTCRGTFPSEGAHNRMCNGCRAYSPSPFAPALTPDMREAAEVEANNRWGGAHGPAPT